MTDCEIMRCRKLDGKRLDFAHNFVVDFRAVPKFFPVVQSSERRSVKDDAEGDSRKRTIGKFEGIDGIHVVACGMFEGLVNKSDGSKEEQIFVP